MIDMKELETLVALNKMRTTEAMRQMLVILLEAAGESAKEVKIIRDWDDEDGESVDVVTVDDLVAYPGSVYASSIFGERVIEGFRLDRVYEQYDRDTGYTDVDTKLEYSSASMMSVMMTMVHRIVENRVGRAFEYISETIAFHPDLQEDCEACN